MNEAGTETTQTQAAENTVETTQEDSNQAQENSN